MGAPHLQNMRYLEDTTPVVPVLYNLQDLGFNLAGSVGGVDFSASKLQDLAGDVYKIKV